MPKLDACAILPPEDDPYLEACFARPSIFSALLRKRSSIVAAGRGHGKSALAHMARRALETDYLNVVVSASNVDPGARWEYVVRTIVEGVWSHIEAQPALLGMLESRARAFKYFAEQHFGPELLNYYLDRLRNDAPEHAALIDVFRALPGDGLFTARAYLDQRFAVLCDAIGKIGPQGIMVWIELPDAHTQEEFGFLLGLFDSVSQMRSKTLYVKCLASPAAAAALEAARGVRTLSVERLDLSWTREELVGIADARIRSATGRDADALAKLVPIERAADFLARVSDPHSPSEWIALARAALSRSVSDPSEPPGESRWRALERGYCAARVRISMDGDGAFWRGGHKLAGLTAKKRAIYPLVKYLYDNPGFHLPYRLETTLNMKPGTLEITLSRARNEHLEDGLSEGNASDDWVYLVTDPKGRGMALLHTDRSP